MKLNRFEVVTGRYIEEILGQSRIGYAMSDTTDAKLSISFQTYGRSSISLCNDRYGACSRRLSIIL